MTKIKLTLKKIRRHVWEAQHNGERSVFDWSPSDRLWRSSYFGENTVYTTLKGAKLAIERELMEKARWIAEQGAA